MELPIDVTISGDLQSLQALDDLLKLQTRLQSSAANEIALLVAIKANQTLHDTKDKYVQALTVAGNVITLDTSDFGVHVAEEGQESFDMKPGLLRSSKAKVAKNGQKYLVVPLPKFRDGKYNWRNRANGQFQKGTNDGPIEFRIVSDASPVDSWIYPKVEGHHFLSETIEEFDIESYMSDFIAKEL